MLRAIVVGLLLSFTPLAAGQMVISEWMYSGSNGEFIEFTNIGAGPVDMAGWSFDDDSQVPGTVDLTAFGVVEPGASVVLTEAVARYFVTDWGLSGVRVIGESLANLSRADQINLYDASGVLVDQLTFGDEDYPGTPRTKDASCNIPPTGYDQAVAQTDWVLATVGDFYGSWTSAGGDIASPGQIVGRAWSDFDEDGDVDLVDFAVFADCVTGAAVAYDPIPAGCAQTPNSDGHIPADADLDGDVDLSDFLVFQWCFSGDGVPADTSCGHIVMPHGVTRIVLHGNSIEVEGPGVTVAGTTATIAAGGEYVVSGVLNDGQIVVDAPGSAIDMAFNGVNISNSTSAPVFVVNAESVEIALADGSENLLSDAVTYIYDDPEEDEPNACLFSKDTLTISGTGTLTVHGRYNDGITSKDELVIKNGVIHVTAVDDGIRGKDSLLIEGGALSVASGGDGLKADNDEDAELGYISIEDGTIAITAGGDGMAAETAVHILGGDFTVTTGGGHDAALPADLSAKGIKGLVSVVIDGGTFVMDCADDGVHSNDAIAINDGDFTITTGDDGIHSDLTMVINGGTIRVTDSYEGIESADITINAGDIYVNSTDDGVNAAGGVDGSGGWPPPSGDHYLHINGGRIVVYAVGDGIDVNGYITMSGGTVIVHGPTASMNAAIDYDRTFNISGGFLVAAGSSQMAQAPSSTSTQRSVKITYSGSKTAGTMAHIETTTGGVNALTFSPSKAYRSVVFSSPALQAGTSFRLYRGGSSTGTATDGLYEGGAYTAGTLTNTFTTNSIVTNVSAP